MNKRDFKNSGSTDSLDNIGAEKDAQDITLPEHKELEALLNSRSKWADIALDYLWYLLILGILAAFIFSPHWFLGVPLSVLQIMIFVQCFSLVDTIDSGKGTLQGGVSGRTMCKVERQNNADAFYLHIAVKVLMLCITIGFLIATIKLDIEY